MKLLSLSIDIYFLIRLKLYKKTKYTKQINIAGVASEKIQAQQNTLIISKVKQITLSLQT